MSDLREYKQATLAHYGISFLSPFVIFNWGTPRNVGIARTIQVLRESYSKMSRGDRLEITFFRGARLGRRANMV